MKYVDYKIKKLWCEDESQFWLWAEFYFLGADNELYNGESPTYEQNSSDSHCLYEDALNVHYRLKEGVNWESVCKSFRQSW